MPQRTISWWLVSVLAGTWLFSLSSTRHGLIALSLWEHQHFLFDNDESSSSKAATINQPHLASPSLFPRSDTGTTNQGTETVSINNDKTIIKATEVMIRKEAPLKQKKQEQQVPIQSQPPQSCDVMPSHDVVISNYEGESIVKSNLIIKVDRNDSAPHRPPLAILRRQSPTEGRPYATCRHMDYFCQTHFPHFMQQLYRCWSFWEQHPDKQAVLTTLPGGLHHNNTQWDLAMGVRYTRDLLDLLPSMGVKVMDPNDIVASLSGTNNDWSDTESISVLTHGLKILNSQMAFQAFAAKDMQALRSKTLAALNISGSPTVESSLTRSPPIVQDTTTTVTNKDALIPRVVVLNRKGSRELLNSQEIRRRLKEHLRLPYEVPELMFETASFAEQVEILSKIDILITPHGAQETGIVFMPQCGAVFEFIPDEYHYPGFFGSLAATSGLFHAFLYLSDRPEGDQSFRLDARKVKICPPIDKVLEGATKLVLKWSRCQRKLQK